MARDLSKMTNIEDLRRVARRKVPKMFFDYVRSGSWTESTLHHNTRDFDPIKFRQRVLVDMTNRTLETTMIGETVKMPVAIAPTGFTGMMYADGEILAAKAAEKFGVPFSLSTMSICGRPHQAGESGELLGADSHRRFASTRPAPPRH